MQRVDLGIRARLLRETRPGAALLWARAAGVGLLAVFLGVAGHVTAGGLLLGPVVLVLLAVGAVALSAPMLARPASALRLVLMMVGGQALVHVVLTVSAGHVGDPAAGPAVRRVGSALPTLASADGRRTGSLQDAYDAVGSSHASTPSVPAHLVADLAAHAPMMVLHLVAAALVGLWLAVGERALWALVAATGRRLALAVRVLLAPVPPAPAAPAPAFRTVLRPASSPRTRPLLRRGPPLVLA